MEKKTVDLNRAAWNEAMEYLKKARGDSLKKGFADKDFTVLNREGEKVILDKLKWYDFRGKYIAQLQCNDGRELLSLMKLGADKGLGFDLSDVAIEEAKKLAGISGLNAKFVTTNILDIGDEYNKLFDLVYISEGSLQWFPDLNEYFKVVSRILKNGGRVYIHEIHPFAYLFEQIDEKNVDPKVSELASYFEHGPYSYPNGMDYVSGEKYEAKECSWYVHKVSDIINALRENDIKVKDFQEYSAEVTNNPVTGKMKNLPLSYLIAGEK